MADHDDEIDGADDQRVSVDPVAAAIAFRDLVVEFSKAYKLVTTDKAKAARLRAVAELDRRAAAAEQKFAAITGEAEQVQAALDARAAALDAGQRALEAREAAFERQTTDVRDELREAHARLDETHRQLIHRIMSTAGILGEWNPNLQPLPSWQQLRGMIADLPADLPGPAPEPAVRIDAFSDTSDNPNSDRHGNRFLGELTRDVSHHQRGAA
jgi:hypothetical protein